MLYNLVVSNVPVPETPFYCNGALVERAYPMGPVTDWGALNITAVSYRRHLTFGIVTCPDVVPDVERLIHALDAEILELHAATVAA